MMATIAAALRETLVRPLNLTAGKVSLNMQIKTDQRESERNRLGLRIGCLSSESIDDMLMDKVRAAVR